ncbi:MAG TPA: hypothetical protein VGR62_09655 [Candidatus Binatia bacterium]|jgi:hypothetical protein|nr:hypothetical protein [Candidatus Binatia bacterium]
MAETLEALEEQAERLKNALAALTNLNRTPQERLDRALAYFIRAFRGEPDEGPLRDCYRTIYAAIGDPPVGTTITASLDTMTDDERDALSSAMVTLAFEVGRRCRDLAAATAAS